MAHTEPAPAPLNIATTGDSLREAFGKALVKLAAQRSDFVVFDADVAGGTGVHHFRKAFPQRFFQFGIAEQNMVAAAGGFAATGVPVFVTTFAAFMLRGLEQARLSVAYARRNVKLVASHPGLDVGPDGGSAQCLEDLAAFRALPGMVVVSPADPLEAELATAAILEYVGPVYMRTGRSPCQRLFTAGHEFQLGCGQVLRQGRDVTLVACGVEVSRALQAADILAGRGYTARVVNMHTIKPIDRALLAASAADTGCFVTAEDHNIHGGLGGAVAECLAEVGPCPIEFVGVRDTFGESGEPADLAEKYGLTASFIADAAVKAINRKRNTL